ncbi:MAG: hypothetical protein DI598_00415 [Pseudopedobacter saltans]|uniref:Uncharacterized protein n=1 Tax=Pseudopedobacter saltans TaxID=151895 RepID=A0A2W5HFX1_9SPHI|nr:MAG: hypothetical protein DI598_00415 [Pseudopedobacter saltans]
MKKYLYPTFAVLITTVLAVSCKKDFDPGATKVSKLAGEWFVALKDSAGNDLSDLITITTYNTSANNDSLYIDDNDNLYGFKVKALANTSDLTFATTNGSNDYYEENYDPDYPQYYPQTLTITDGKVLLKAGTSLAGNVTDSIYFKVKFSFNPDKTYIIAGTGRTNWDEDQP